MAPSRAVAGALAAGLAAALTGTLTAALARAQAVTHFDVPALQREVSYDLGDLRGVPNALFDSEPGFPNGAAFAIRGGAAQWYEPSFDPAVGVYQDGIYLGRTGVPILELYDLESVEVARGPQGLLSGRASPAGAIELRSHRPSGKFGTRGQVSFGDRGFRDYRLGIDVPLVPERLAGSLAVFERQSSGHFPNAAPPGGGGRLDDEARWGMRGALRFTPADAFELTLIADVLEDRSGGPPLHLATSPISFHVAQEMPEHNRSDLSGLVADASFDLGRLRLRSLSGWRSANQNLWVDLDAQPTVILESRQGQGSGQFSEELSVSSDLVENTLALELGWIYWQAHASLAQTNTLEGGIELFARARQELRSNGFFGSLRWTVTDALALQAGARRSADAQSLGLTLPLGLGQLDGSEHFDKLAPSLRMDFKPAQDVAIWAGYDIGYRPGGFDTLPGGIEPLSYGSEVRRSLHAGVRSAWLDERLAAAASVFYDRVTGLQITPLADGLAFLPGGVTTRNASSARFAGVELELLGRPLDSLSVRASAGYLDAAYLDLETDPDIEADDPDPVRSPRFSSSLGVTWTFALGAAGRFEADAAWYYVSHYSTDVANQPFADVPATSLYDASLTWRPGRSAWRVTAYGKNLLNREVAGGGVRIGESLLLNTPIPPRTYGVQIGWEYDDLGDLVQ